MRIIVECLPVIAGATLPHLTDPVVSSMATAVLMCASSAPKFAMTVASDSVARSRPLVVDAMLNAQSSTIAVPIGAKLVLIFATRAARGDVVKSRQVAALASQIAINKGTVATMFAPFVLILSAAEAAPIIAAAKLRETAGATARIRITSVA